MNAKVMVGMLLAALLLPAAARGDAVILKMDPVNFDGSMWRVFQTWQTDAAKMPDGSIVRVDPFDPRVKDAGANKVKPATKIIGSEFPSPEWTKPDFDDTAWQQPPGATRYLYRSLALMCIRGRFEVKDPAKAGTLSLSLTYHGGVIVYLNGQEIGRQNLPVGKIDNDTLADEYPKEAYVNGNALIGHLGVFGVQNVEGYTWADISKSAGLQARQRKLTIPIPAASLRKGVNMLSLEVHRAPANPVMFTTTTPKFLESGLRMDDWWNRNEVQEVSLTASGDSSAIIPNAGRPKGFEVWNYSALDTVDDMRFGDPNEKLQPIHLVGARNGVYTGEVIVSSGGAVKNLKVAVTDLKSDAGSIPLANIQISYPRPNAAHWTYLRAAQLDFDILDPTVADTIPPLKANQPANVTMQPVWFSVSVPKDAKPGVYKGNVTINAEGQKAVETPIMIKVVDWTLPDAKDFTTYVGLVESPDTVAMQYKVEPWSDAHWKILDQVFTMMAQLGDKELYIPLVRQSFMGNPQTMVRWVKQADGTLKPDFTLVEKYVDLAVKHLGKIPMVCAVTTEPNEQFRAGLLITEVDPKTGELKESVGPAWGTAESKALLKQAFDGLKEILAKRGMPDSLMVGTHAGRSESAGPLATPAMVSDITAAFPEVRWVRASHYWFNESDRRAGGPKFGRIALVGGVLGVFWDPDRDKPIYGWLNPEILIVYPRTTNMDYAGVRLGQESGLGESRLFAEAVLTSGRRRQVVSTRGNIAGEMGYDNFKGLRGVGPFGVDFWPVLKGANGDKAIIGRYGDGYQEGGWGTVSMNQVVQWLIAPGKDGPIPTMRSQMMRESLQEAEARILIQNALLNEASKAKLGADLAKRATDLCYDRTQAMRYVSEFWEAGIINPGLWEAKSEAMYNMAAEVAKALAK